MQMNMRPDVMRIPVEGPRAPKPRNVPRIIIEVETEVSLVVGDHYVHAKQAKGGGRLLTTARVEIYADQLPDVMTRQYRTEDHKRAWALACEMHQRLVDQWCEERAEAMKRMSESERAEYIRSRCNLGPAQHLPVLGYKRGIPNLLAVRVVSQVDPTKTVDAADFGALTDEERREFLGTAPATGDNALDRTGQMIADALEKALSAMNKKR